LTNHTLADLGWSAFQMSQLALDELDLPRFRIAEIHRNRLVGLGPEGETGLTTHEMSSSLFAVGDFVLADNGRITRVLDRKTLISRRAAGEEAAQQLIAANVDTLLIVTSCNADFNLKRLERYLTMALDCQVEPVIILTKSDTVTDPESYLEQARALRPGLEVLALDARSPDVTERLALWCRKGQTVALTGSSGVGKTTLSNALTGLSDATQGIREDDARGRHTTTFRVLRPMPNGGWIIDTPGMREIGLADVADGLEQMFDDIAELAATCRFHDCRHVSEPGCAVQLAMAEGRLDSARFERFDKLQREDRFNSESLRERANRSRNFGKFHKRLMKERKQWTTKD
jgi:ribosome biogenesis GTPase / thiamine phosphate phosphatase